jgi:ATP/maltotriose-dependent transcriptional regulator MalT
MSQADDLYREGVEAFRRGDDQRSRELSEQSLALAGEDVAATVNALMGLARVALRTGDLERVHALAAEARTLAPDEASLVLPLHLDAEATRMGGDLAAARTLYEESISLNRRLGDTKMVEFEQANLAWVEINEGNLHRAAELIRGSLAGALGESAYGRAFGAIALARCAAERGDRAQARELLGEADRELEAEGLVLDPADRLEYEQTVEFAQG